MRLNGLESLRDAFFNVDSCQKHAGMTGGEALI